MGCSAPAQPAFLFRLPSRKAHNLAEQAQWLHSQWLNCFVFPPGRARQKGHFEDIPHASRALHASIASL